MFRKKPKRFLVIQQSRRVSELEKKDTIIQSLTAVEERKTEAYNYVHGLMTYDEAVRTARTLNANRASIMNRAPGGGSYVYLVIEVVAEFWTEHSYSVAEKESLLADNNEPPER